MIIAANPTGSRPKRFYDNAVLVQPAKSIFETGDSNTRSKCHSESQESSASFGNSYRSADLATGIDWLGFTFDNLKLPNFQQLVEYLSDSLRDTIILEPGTSAWFGRTWGSSGFAVGGCKLFWDTADSGDIHRLIIEINGGSLKRLTLRDVWRMCLGLNHVWGATCRRFDAYIDDYARRVDFWDVVRHCEAGEVNLVKTFSIFAKGDCGKRLIPTVYFGSRESEKYLRFYNAELKHGIKADRWELELKRRHAQEAFRRFCAFGDSAADITFNDPTLCAKEKRLLGSDEVNFGAEIAPFLAGLVTGAVDFTAVDPDNPDERYSRRERLPWWASLVEESLKGNDTIRLSPARTKPSLERSIQWFKKQVSCFLSCVREGWGRGYFYRWLDAQLKDGKLRFGNYHRAVVEALRCDAEEGLCEVLPAPS